MLSPHRVLVWLTALALLGACADGEEPLVAAPALSRLSVDRTYLRDQHGRYVQFHGVNLSGSTKVPLTKDQGGKTVTTYIGKPFPLETAATHMKTIRDQGFNVLRLLLMWEGVEPDKKGQYDTAYLAYIRDIVKLAGQYGLYVLLDFHQDMFSRHLKVNFNDKPKNVEPGTLEWTLMSLVPGAGGYTEAVQGDGAPRWVVQACLPEKKMDSVNWGTPRILSGLDQDASKVNDIYQLFARLLGLPTTGPMPTWTVNFLLGLPKKFEVNETTDMLPFTNWGLAHTTSLDVARCYACLFAGDKAFPKLTVENKTIKDYLQEAYAAAWVKVAEQVKDLHNVIGYDLMNEPGGNFIVLTAVAGMIKFGAAAGAKSALVSLLGQTDGEDMYDALITLRLLPPDTKAETLKAWGLDQVDVTAVLGLNNGFDDNFLRPFYERVAKAILAVDPRAVFYIEGSMNVSLVTGGGGTGGLGGFWEVPMQHPQGAELQKRFVFAPHWYPDIYPFLGFNVEPRAFTTEEVRYRNYQPKLEEAMHLAAYSMGNIPVVFGEFGTYFNFNNRFKSGGELVNNAKTENYQVSAYILNNYYEAFERMFQSHIQWCTSTENDERKGDLWNREDFSVLGPDGKNRAELAWNRPHARALAGKPIATHFHSDYHYFDPDKGTVDPKREFMLRYAAMETRAPSEIFVPKVQYPDGFYVWLSDGYGHWDPERQVFYHFPEKDEPGTVHWVRILPPLQGNVASGYRYFIKGDRVVSGR